MTARTIPEPYRSVTPYLCVDGAAKALDFYKQAFGAKERMRLDMPNGKLAHAEMMIGDCVVMLADVSDEGGLHAPTALSGSTASMHIYVDDDVDTMFVRAIEAGAKKVSGLQNMFYGDRSGTVRDPFGHVWILSMRKEDISLDELKRRALEIFHSR